MVLNWLGQKQLDLCRGVCPDRLSEEVGKFPGSQGVREGCPSGRRRGDWHLGAPNLLQSRRLWPWACVANVVTQPLNKRYVLPQDPQPPGP